MNRCQMAEDFVRQEEDAGFSPGATGKLRRGLVNTHAWLVNRLTATQIFSPPHTGHPCLTVPQDFTIPA